MKGSLKQKFLTIVLYIIILVTLVNISNLFENKINAYNYNGNAATMYVSHEVFDPNDGTFKVKDLHSKIEYTLPAGSSLDDLKYGTTKAIAEAGNDYIDSNGRRIARYWYQSYSNYENLTLGWYTHKNDFNIWRPTDTSGNIITSGYDFYDYPWGGWFLSRLTRWNEGTDVGFSSIEYPITSSTGSTKFYCYYVPKKVSLTASTNNANLSIQYKKWSFNKNYANGNAGNNLDKSIASLLTAEWSNSTYASSRTETEICYGENVTIYVTANTGYHLTDNVGNNNCIQMASDRKTATYKLTCNSNSTTLYIPTTIDTHTVTYIDRINGTSTNLGSSTATKNYGTSVSGADKGTSTTVGAYYTGYKLTSYDSPKTVTGNTTIYRYFTAATINQSASGYTGNYDGKTHGITVTSSTSGATIKYGTTSGTYNLTSSPTYTNAGTYTVYYQITASGYNAVTGSQKVTINKAPNTLTLSSTSGSVKYPETKTSTFTITQNVSGGTLSVKSSNTGVTTVGINGTTVTMTNTKGKGTTTITVTSAETKNYLSATATYTLNVSYSEVDVTYIDVIDSTSGTKLKTQTKKVTYGSTVRGYDLGNNTKDGAYYKNYYLASDTSMTAAETNNTVYRIFKASPLNITAIPNNDEFGSVTVDWNTYDYFDNNFKVYKSEDGIKFESVGIDYRLVKEVKVLHLYPISNASTQLTTWMETNKYGKDIIKVTPVALSSFNSNPNGYLKNTDGTWKYDVIFVGTWDGNAKVDFSTTARDALITWIESGKGFIAGHDVFAKEPGYYVASTANTLAKYCGVQILRTYTSGTMKAQGTEVYISKKGLFTTYPWEIGDLGTVLTVPKTHTLGQDFTQGTTWLKFVNSSDEKENSYLVTKNNCAMIQTGHSQGAATVDEQKIIANLIFYCNQLLFNTYTTNDMSAQDSKAPNAPIITESNNIYNFSTKDLGNDYYYYVESFGKNDTTLSGRITVSDIEKVNVETGVKGYYYVADNNSTTIATKNHTFTEVSSVSLSEITGNKYLHVAAIDGAGNLSSTTTIELPYINNYTVNYYLQNLDGTYKLEETLTNTAIIGTTITPEVKIFKGFKVPTTQSIIIETSTNNVNYYYERNKYTVIYIDVIDSTSGNVINTQTSQAYYGKIVNGSDIGNDTNDNVYHNGYYYSSCTTAEVTTNGATVYRIFKLRTIDINGSVNWNDKSNAYNSRPEVTITLLKNGQYLSSITGFTSKDNNTYGFTDLQKYDTTTGEPYVYTVSQSEIISKNAPEDKYTTTVDSTGLNFTNTLGNADFHIEGSITWVDGNNEKGTRPKDITLNLYQNNKLFQTQIIANNETGYSFVNLPKYDDNLNSYTYKVEETFVSKALIWDSDTKEHKEIDAYKIEVEDFDFTNTLNYIPVKPEYTNTLTLKLDFNDNINWVDIEKVLSEVTSFITLKQFETVVDADKNISYTSNYNGMEYKAIVNELGVTINNIPSGKYEIVESNDNTFVLEGINLQTNSSISVVNENNKWYLIIAETNQNQTGTISLNMNIDSFNGVDDSMILNNLYSLGNTSTAQVMMMSMFSDEVTVPEYVEPITYTITYKDCDVVDDTKYSENSEATLKDCEIEGFLGWSENSEATEPQYIARDKVKLEKDLILYPVIETPEQSSEEITEEIESEETYEEEETTKELELENPNEEEITELEVNTDEELLKEIEKQLDIKTIEIQI